MAFSSIVTSFIADPFVSHFKSIYFVYPAVVATGSAKVVVQFVGRMPFTVPALHPNHGAVVVPPE